MKRLAAMQVCPPFPKREAMAIGNGFIEIGIIQHHEWITAAEFHHAFLEITTGVGCHRFPGTFATSQRNGMYARISDDIGGILVVDVQHTENAIRNSSQCNHFGDHVGTARHIGRMLEQGDIAGH